MLPFTNVSHISVTVTDVEQARDFYGSVVGLKEIPRPAFRFPGSGTTSAATCRST